MKNWKISTKLFACVAALLVIGLAISGVSVWLVRSISQKLDESNHRTAVKLDYANAIRARIWEMVAHHRATFLMYALETNHQVGERITEWEAARTRAHLRIEEIRSLLDSDEENKKLQNIEASMNRYESTAREFMRLVKEGKLQEVTPLLPQVAATTNQVVDAATQMAAIQQQRLHESDVQATSLRTRSLWLNSAALCLLLAVGVVVGLIVRDVNRTLAVAISELSEGAAQVASAASQVASSSQSLAQGASEQAASLEETSASSEEISSMSRRNSDHARNAAGLVQELQRQVEQTHRSLDQMNSAMDDISSQSDKISKIIKVIDEIAFQTNILALNAAVEAARAGEAGMGFAVVADEVRNLAQRCALAARDTSSLIEESIAKSKGGKGKVDQVAEAVRVITSGSAQVKTLVDEVHLGSEEQMRGFEQIGKTLSQMDTVTQSTAASAEESASAAEELSAQSHVLRDIVGRLRELIGGASVNATVASARPVADLRRS